MVAHWEKKTRDVEYVENTVKERGKFIDKLIVEDPEQYLSNPPIIYRYNECVRITLMAQNMTAQFVASRDLFNNLPVEVQLVEASSFVKGDNCQSPISAASGSPSPL